MIKRTLTTKEKISIYSEALRMMLMDIDNPLADLGGFCWYITNAVSAVIIDDLYPTFTIHLPLKDNSAMYYPELFKYEPKKLVRGFRGKNDEPKFWFNASRKQGMLKRVKILQDEIALLQAQL